MQKTWISSGRKRLNTSMMASNFNGHCLFRPWGWRGGGWGLSWSTQLVSHGTKFYIHDHDMGGFRCKYIYFDTGPDPWTNEKVVVVKKKKKGGGGNVGRISYLISFSRINFRGKSILYAWLFIHILLLICASPGCIEREEKGRPANPVLVFVLVNNYTHTPHAVTSLFWNIRRKSG